MLSCLIFFCFPVQSNNSQPSHSHSKNIQLNFDHWEIIYNCDNRGYEYFHYITYPDSGKLSRVKRFHQEAQLPQNCQQFTTHTYASVLPKNTEQNYDLGHGIHQNLWDDNRATMQSSNSMANILPQASKLNRYGPWRFSEKLTECYRQLGEVEVWGGVIWGADSSNDHFYASHGVITPDYLWKLIKFPNGTLNAWIFPNENATILADIDLYLVDYQLLSGLINQPLPFEFDQAASSETLPAGCDLQ